MGKIVTLVVGILVIRVQFGGIRGEVIDIGGLRTTIMEIGE